MIERSRGVRAADSSRRAFLYRAFWRALWNLDRLANDPTAAPERLAQLARDTADPAIARSIAQHPQTLIEARPYITLADRDTAILLALAGNPDAPDRLLGALYEHPTVRAIRDDLDANPNDQSDYAGYLPDFSREQFLEALHEALARHANTPESLLAQLADEKRIAAWVAQNPSASPDLLLGMARRFSWNADEVLAQIARAPQRARRRARADRLPEYIGAQ